MVKSALGLGVKVSLWAHQEEAVKRAKRLDNFALFFEPGTGKTRTVINILLDKYHRHRRILNTLVLTPLVVVEQFEREFHAYSDKVPKGLVMALKGPNWKRLRFLEDNLKCGFNVIAITNYEALYSKQLFDKLLDFAEVLVCDESSKLKEPSAKRSKLTQKIADKCRYRYILSGTPILSSPMDIYQQFRILDGGQTFGANFYIFRAQHFIDKNATWRGNHNYFPNWVPKEDCSKSISEKISPISMHIKKEEAIDLPPLVKKEVFVEMSAEQKKAYQEMRDFFVTVVREKTAAAQLVLTKLLRLQQIVSGFLKFDDDTEREFYECPRLDALSELLEETTPTDKVIVWAVFKRNYSQIRKVCERLKLSYVELTGETEDKDDSVLRFNTDPTVRVLIGNQAAGGIGVNLTAAGTAIYYSKNFSLENDVQSAARNYRGGSLEYGHKKITRIDLCTVDTIDSLINDAIKNKLATSEEILGLIRKRL